MIETGALKSLHQLHDPVNIPHLDKTKLKQTLEPDDENMIEVVEDEPEEEPPKIYTTKKEVKKRQSDTLSSTTTVFSAHEPQETILYTVHEDDYEENVFVEATYKENVIIEATYKGDRDAKTFQGNLKIEDTHEEENVFIEATYRENVSINATYQEDRHAETFQGDLKIEDTYEVDVLNLTFMKKDVQLMIDDADIEGRDAKTSQGNLMIEDTYEYPTHEADYKEDVFVKDDQQYMMHTQQGTAHREDKDAKTLHGHTVIKNTYKKDVLARQVVTDNAYQGNMLTVSPQENVVLMNAYKKYVQSAVDKITVKRTWMMSTIT
jgi:hypothetical protein